MEARQVMQLPFTETQFLDNFGAFNAALWPVLAVLWVASLVLATQLMRGRPRSAALGLLLMAHWLWAAGAYHAAFFSRINPAAWLFAALFTAQAVALAWHATYGGGLTFVWRRSWRHAGAAVFILYALAYPALVQLTGHEPPRAPLFGVPCPTALLTAGLLLATEPPAPRGLLVIPVAWSLLAGTAALLLGVTPDLMLFAAAAALVVDAAFAAGRSRRGRPSLVERERPRAVDRLVAGANYRQVLAIDITARPENIWPWLVQLGYQRGGLYSYDWLDRLFGFLDRPSADRILLEYQDLRPGDVIPMGRGGGFPVAAVDPSRSLVLGGEQDGLAWGWELALEPLGDRRTRLVSRNLGRTPGTWRSRVWLAVLRPAAFIMTHRMLSGIRRRAEAMARPDAGASLHHAA
jgi:hypothetical protein